MSLILLRQHVEAVWGVRLPALAPGDNNALPSGSAALSDFDEPGWALYWAETAQGAVRIWQPGVAAERRAPLLARAASVWARAADELAPAGARREVAHALGAVARLSVAEAGRVARLLDEGDVDLLEAYEPGESGYYTDPAHAPVIGVVTDGRLVCVAHSSRRTGEACELGIETRSGARRHGYALAATVLWTTAIQGEGLVPLYSAFAENAASLALAAAAGYRPFARAVYVTD
jgi:hypothetical protein